MKINEFICFYRKIKGLTQEKLAEVCSVNSNTFSQYETGTRNIPQDVLAKLAGWMGFSFKLSPSGYEIELRLDQEELEHIVQEYLKKELGVKPKIQIYLDEEYNENVWFCFNRDDNEDHIIEKIEKEFGDEAFNAQSFPSLIMDGVFNAKNVRFYNQMLNAWKFETIVEIPIEKK